MICRSGEKLKPNKMLQRNGNKIENKISDKPGFTLFEMLTSISIIVMITAIFMANYHANNQRTDLVMTAQKLVSDIHAAQNNTLGLNKYGTDVPPGGWGLHFDTSTNKQQYIMFADLDRPASDEPGQIHAADAGFLRYDADEGDVNFGARVVDLPAGIEISSLNTGNGTTTLANVTFLPPDPKTNIYDGSVTSTWLSISLRDKAQGIVKTVKVNFLGLAEVIN